MSSSQSTGSGGVEPSRTRPAVRSAGTFEELKEILRSLSPVLHDVIAARRTVSDPSDLEVKHERFAGAFRWLRESYSKLESDLQWVSHRDGERSERADFYLYLIIRKGVECELQITELEDLALERRRKREQQAPLEPSERVEVGIEAPRIVAAYHAAIGALSRGLLLLGADNCFDALETRIRMLTGMARIHALHERYPELFVHPDTETLNRATDLSVKIESDLITVREYLTRQSALDAQSDSSRYATQLELLPGLGSAFDDLRRKMQRGAIREQMLPAAEREPQSDSVTGWDALAAEHGILRSKVTEERLWILSPLQREVVEAYYGVPSDTGRARKPVRDWTELDALLTAEGYRSMGAEHVRELFEHSIRHLKLFENGWQWLALECGMTVQAVKNRFKLGTIQEAETTLTFFGIGGPRQAFANAHDGPAPHLVTTLLDRIKGRQDEALVSLRRPHKQGDLSPRLREVLSTLYKVESSFTVHQIQHHIAELSKFESWGRYEAVLDLALNSAKYLHCAGEIKDALRAECERFVRRIPEPLWREPALIGARDLAPILNAPRSGSEPSANSLARILRTVGTTDRLNYLGEVVLGIRMKLYAEGATADPAKLAETRDLFISAKYGLAVSVSKEFTGSSLREDLIQEGIPALIAAVDGFEPALGLRFSTQAYLPMKSAMKRLIQRTVRERTGLHLKTQDKLNAFERDCDRAGVYPLELSVSNEALHAAISKIPGAAERTIEEVRRLRAIIFLSGCSSDETGGEYLPGSKISLESAAPEGDGEEPLEIQIADPNARLPGDPEAAQWIGETLRKGWEERLFEMALDRKQLERDLEVYRAMKFTPKPLSAPEIAEIENVHPNTVRRAVAEIEEVLVRRALPRQSEDREIASALRSEGANPDTIERNLRMYRRFTVPLVSTKEIAERYEIDESNARLICRKLEKIADEIGVQDGESEQGVVTRMQEELSARARRKASEEAAVRMRVVERVAFADGETLDAIGTSFGFSGSMVRYIMIQAREVATALNLREQSRG